jgi:putative addiction module component (TIGR02574 family)
VSVTDIPNFEKLSDLQRVELAEDLFASVRDPQALPIPVAHQLELQRRWSDYERSPHTVLSSEQFWAEVNALKK